MYDAALVAMQSEHPNVAEVAAMLREAIEAGSSQAAYALATWYLFGKDDVVPQDYTEAVRLLRLAADAHQADALFDLAVCYANGEGVDIDKSKSFELFLMAALHGDDEAVFKVGQAYYYGVGVMEDRRVGDIWFDRSRELGTFEAEPDAEPDDNAS